jgi:flagellin-like hook-associated protein FlgL
MRPIQITLSFAAADPNSVVTAETPADGVDLTIAGAFASGGVATFPEPTTVDFTSADDISDVTFTITGTNSQGTTIFEDVTGVDNDTVSTIQLFKTVTSIAVATVTTYTTETVEVGNPDTPSFGTGPWWPLDIYTPNQVTTISANELSGAVTYSVEYTNEDPFDTSITQLAVAHPAAAGAFTGATTDQTHFTTTLMRAVRVNLTAGYGDLRVTVVQQSTA